MTRGRILRPGRRGHVEQLRAYDKAGFDEIYVANMGPHYLEMIEAYGRDVLPALSTSS